MEGSVWRLKDQWKQSKTPWRGERWQFEGASSDKRGDKFLLTLVVVFIVRHDPSSVKVSVADDVNIDDRGVRWVTGLQGKQDNQVERDEASKSKQVNSPSNHIEEWIRRWKCVSHWKMIVGRDVD